MNISRFKNNHIHGPGGIAQLLPIAFPIIVSQASDTAMMFVDRLYLAHVSDAHMAAAMTGGLTAFTSLTFFVGIINYTNALVAQHFGAHRKNQCPSVVIQGLAVVGLSLPVIVLMVLFGPHIFELFGHAPEQIPLEQRYFRILMGGSVILMARLAFSGFFAGIGRTRVVMVANLVAMCINIVVNYVLIFGKLGFPPMNITGAAIGTVFSRFCGLAILVAVYLSRKYRLEFGTHLARSFNPAVFSKLIRFGLPTGIELCLNVTAFNLVVQSFHSYGSKVAAAVTITFNWDMVAFVPMLGFNIATMSLVGRFMGGEDSAHAERSAYSGLKLAYIYAGVLMCLFIFAPAFLAKLFIPAEQSMGSEETILPLARNMIRLAAIYTLADATYLTIGGALRGAGDTKWVMAASVLLHWFMVAVMMISIHVLTVHPLHAWILFVGCVALFGSVMCTRFRRGVWKKIRVVEAPVGGSDTVPPDGTIEGHKP